MNSVGEIPKLVSSSLCPARCQRIHTLTIRLNKIQTASVGIFEYEWEGMSVNACIQDKNTGKTTNLQTQQTINGANTASFLVC